jgi:hypothetical protein
MHNSVVIPKHALGTSDYSTARSSMKDEDALGYASNSLRSNVLQWLHWFIAQALNVMRRRSRMGLIENKHAQEIFGRNISGGSGSLRLQPWLQTEHRASQGICGRL